MIRHFYLIIILFFVSCNAPSIEADDKKIIKDNSDSIDLKIEKVLSLVAEQKIVIDQIQLIDSLSQSKRHVSFLPALIDTTKNIYLVKVVEDNGSNLVTYFNFLVDANSMIIINEDGKYDEF